MTKSPLSRREFLKFAGLLPFVYGLPAVKGISPQQKQSEVDNLLILVFDAWSAGSMSLYGYPRLTTPNLDKLAQKAIVYHNHYAGGHYTSPGTASLLTGTTPWTHRAFNFYSTVEDHLSRSSIFNAVPDYHRFAYTHNPVADVFLKQFLVDIDTLTPLEDLYKKDPLSFIRLFKNDVDVGSISQNRSLNQGDDGFSYSLYLSRIYDYFTKIKKEEFETELPRGIPNFDNFNFFIFEEGIDWLAQEVKSSPTPFLGYYHFYPPHEPYYTRVEFVDAFLSDSYQQIPKGEHFFKNRSEEVVINERRWYDEFILYVDAEIARLYQTLEASGILENTWILITSDHGEMFERGIVGHLEPVFYQPLVRIPLLIFPPGQSSRIDIYENTNAVDILPTIAKIAGVEIPGWSEGIILPPLNETDLSQARDISTIQVEIVDENSVVTQATAMILRGRYKLTWYFGYEQTKPDLEYVEFFDLDSDPEELDNLYHPDNSLADDLLSVLKSKLSDLNRSYQENR